MSSRKSNLTVPPGWSTQDKRFGEGVKENLDVLLGHRGNPLQRAVTFQDLLDSNLVQLSGGSSGFFSIGDIVPFVNNFPDLVIPPAPTNLQASGAFQNIILSWNLSLYKGHSIVEVFRHTSDDIAAATMVAQVSGFTGVYADPVGSGQTFYYWVRAINVNDVPGPFNTGTGTQGQTAPDVSFLLTTLSNAITTSELASSLSTPIGNLPTDTQTAINDLQSQVNAIGAVAQWSSSTSYSQDDLTLYPSTNSKLYRSKTNSNSNNQPSGNTSDTTYWEFVGTGESIGDVVANNTANITQINFLDATSASAAAQKIASLDSTLNDPSTGLSATSTALSGLTTRVTTTEGDISTANSNISGNTASITANAADITTLENTVNNPSSGVAATSSALSSLTSTVSSQGSSISANATSLSSLSTTVAGNTTSISSQATSINGLEAKYVVKIDNNGAVAGYGLASTANSAGNITSEFIVNADRFAIMRGGSNTTAASVPFVVQTSSTTLGGETVPAGVYIDAAFIKNGSIQSAKIGDATIDNAKIASIDAGKINAGTINTSRLNIDGSTLTSVNGVLQIANLAVTNAKIANLAVNNAKIGNLAVSTLKIQDQAVTFPNAITTTAALTIASSSNNTTFSTIQTLTGTYSGAPVLISGSFAVRAYDDQALMRFRLRRGSAILFTSSTKAVRPTPDLFIIPFNFLDTSTSSGTRTYTLQAYVQDQFGIYSDRTISTLEVKK